MGRKEHVLTSKFIWNTDRSLLNITIKVPSKKGLVHQDFQISREEFIKMEILYPVKNKFESLKGNAKNNISPEKVSSIA